jgi:hypothetical protein
VGVQSASATAMRRISVSRFAFREHTTGGLRPPLLYCGANVRRRKTVFSTHKRTPKKSGGREPAVGLETRLRRHERDCSADRRRCMCGSPLHSRAAVPRGGLRPPLLRCDANVCRRKNDFSDAPTHTEKKSGGRQPAVGSQTASATAMRRISVSRFAFREHTTGG